MTAYAAETLLKGPEGKLPGDGTFLDKDGTERSEAEGVNLFPTHRQVFLCNNLG